MPNLPPNELTIQTAPAIAKWFAESSQQFTPIKLDYSPKSIKGVEQLATALLAAGANAETHQALTVAMGCYVGQVMVKHANGKWRDAAKTPMAGLGTFPIVIEMDEGNFANPLGKAYKRMSGIEGEDLAFFYQAMTADSSTATVISAQTIKRSGRASQSQQGWFASLWSKLTGRDSSRKR